MIISLGFYKRRPGLTKNQFSNHWANIHGPLIRSIPNLNRYLTRYVQHHLTPDDLYPVPAGMEFDGFSEVWFTSHEAKKQLFADEFFKSKVVADEALFIDMAATRWIVMDEPRVMIDSPPLV
jgi:uncharacterized protein (TIGR02118 family)